MVHGHRGRHPALSPVYRNAPVVTQHDQMETEPGEQWCPWIPLNRWELKYAVTIKDTTVLCCALQSPCLPAEE